jgi:lysophospholipase L1-like esterase
VQLHCTKARGPLMTQSSTLRTARLFASLALFPLAAIQGKFTSCRVPRLTPAMPPHSGTIRGNGKRIRLLAIGESSVSGVGVSHGDETMAAAAARALARDTGRPVTWRAHGLSGATVRKALDSLLPTLARAPIDLLIIAFGVNDAIAYRSPNGFADDLEEFVTTVRHQFGKAAVVIAGVAPLISFPVFPWPLRNLLGWRSEALQEAAEQLPRKFGRLVVERFPARIEAHLFTRDRFHPNAQAHRLWGEDLAALGLPMLVSDPGTAPTRFH